MTNTKKILLIDDEKKFTDFVGMAFSAYREEVTFFAANRGDLGLEIALREKPDVVAVDLIMPGMVGGEELLKKLKAQLPAAKFIVVTAWNDGRNKERIIEEIGVDGYFEKPLHLRVFVEQVLRYLNVTSKKKTGESI